MNKNGCHLSRIPSGLWYVTYSDHLFEWSERTIVMTSPIFEVTSCKYWAIDVSRCLICVNLWLWPILVSIIVKNFRPFECQYFWVLWSWVNWWWVIRCPLKHFSWWPNMVHRPVVASSIWQIDADTPMSSSCRSSIFFRSMLYLKVMIWHGRWHGQRPKVEKWQPTHVD